MTTKRRSHNSHVGLHKSALGLESREATQSNGSGEGSSFPIVAIGASAGGLEAFTSLIKTLPPNVGMAFALIPHLDPSRESAYAQILARATAMPVMQVEDGMRVEKNCVYIIPPNCDLTIRDAVLHLKNREEIRVGNITIDIFMRSLAADQGSNAIGVVLSGTGSDGTAGLRAIKGEGGITFAQDTESAKYDGMPASAMAADCVDFALPPEEIAHELSRMSQHPYVAGARTVNAEIAEPTGESYMTQVFRVLRRVTRVDFSEYKLPTITRRIQRRMVLHKVDRLEDYLALLTRDRDEVAALYKDLLINVTSFFRNPEAFDALKQNVYPAILQARGSSSAPIRIWVPGCSTGEEAYSHAMSLVEFLGEERMEVPIQIFGTDLSENAIQHARMGIYKENIEADVNPTRLRRFFNKPDAGYQISKTIRDLCIFSTQNVFNDPPFSRIDLVSCRNVMIYLSQSLQKRVIPTFHYALNPMGFLMLGNTEGLLVAGAELFEMVDKKQKIYRKKAVSTPVSFSLSVGHTEHDSDRAPAPMPQNKPLEEMKPPELQREADRLLLVRYAPPAVVVNDHMEIVQSRGRTGMYLELPAGKASLNLLKMARPGLLFDLQSAVEEARKNETEARRENIQVEMNGSLKPVNVRVVPFKTPVQDRYSFLIVFEPVAPEAEPRPERGGPPLTGVKESDKDKQLGQLRQELAATKEYLQAIIETQEGTNEELQSANEEIQSGNEELQSTNEELQTSKEELESANEELHTVNEEMQHRNELLAQLNNDLVNLLNSVNLPIVMVGADLSVRRYTPHASSALGLMASDVGRPMPRLKLKIDASSLEEKMLAVMEEVQPKQYQLQDNEGNWRTLRITPYRTLDNRIDGVVLTVLDNGSNETPAPKNSGAKGNAGAGAQKKSRGGKEGR